MLRVKLLLIAFIVLISSCIQKNTQFTTDDSQITLLMENIQEYEVDQGYPPTNLDELVPNYIQTIPIPASTDKVEYSLDQMGKFWTLTYYAKSGTICTYESRSRSWGCTAFVK